jgi:hypothetical protein
MKISIFPESNPHPKSKGEKVKEARKTSAPFLPVVKTISNEQELIDLVCNNSWSPAIFNGVRKAANFVSCDFLVYDIDEGLTIDEADKILQSQKLCYLILPSPSHVPVTNERFRVIMPLAYSITDIETFNNTWKAGARILQAVDEQCCDSCRFYFGSTDDDGVWQEGDFFEPVKKIVPENRGYVPSQTSMIDVTEDMKELVLKIYGKERDKVPEAVDYFIKNAHTGIRGGWVSALNSFTFSLSLSGIDDTIIWELCEQLAPDPLDSRDIYQIKKAIRDGQKHSEF